MAHLVYSLIPYIVFLSKLVLQQITQIIERRKEMCFGDHQKYFSTGGIISNLLEHLLLPNG